jgi:pimeloyl-ACP methyl ester carboxylesterase
VRRSIGVLLALLALAPPAAAHEIGTSFPEDFPEIRDASLGTPVIGFGASGPLARVPVILLHGNNDTPYPTDCNANYGQMHDFAQYLHDEAGYAHSELWALGWQGEQCDLQTNPPARSDVPHTVAANVADLRAFVRALLQYTGAQQVDIVAHSLGSTLAREWMRQDDAYATVRNLVAVDGTNHGIINCSPSPRNYYASPALGNFHPDSPLCQEVGSVRTPLMAALNAGDETPGPTVYTTVVNTDQSFVYIEAQDGPFPPVPSEDRDGRPHDFSRSAWLDGATNHGLTGQAKYGAPGTGTAHVAINNSPETWAIAARTLAQQVPAPPAAERAASAGPPRRLTISRRRARRVMSVRVRLTGAPCTGKVRISVLKDGRRVASRRVALRRDCTALVQLRVGRARGLRIRARHVT